MAGGKIRSIKPEILEDARTAELSDGAFRLFISSIVLADDYGNLRGDSRWLESQVWWARRDSPRTAANVGALIGELVDAELVEPYEARGQEYLHIRSWEKHQRIDNAAKPKIPKPSDGSPISAEKFREPPLKSAGLDRKGVEEEGIGGEGSGAGGGLPPTLTKPRRKAFGHSIPDDWKPSDSHREFAAKHGVDLQFQADKFRNDAVAKARRYTVWNSAFSNWLQQQAQWDRERRAAARPVGRAEPATNAAFEAEMDQPF